MSGLVRGNYFIDRIIRLLLSSYIDGPRTPLEFHAASHCGVLYPAKVLQKNYSKYSSYILRAFTIIQYNELCCNTLVLVTPMGHLYEKWQYLGSRLAFCH